MTTEAHVINVKERTDRWATFQESWKDMPLTLNRRDAIKPDGVEVLDVYHAVFLKHREILTTAQKLGEKHVLIMEDDAYPGKDFAKHWAVIKEYLDARDDWELFNGGMLMIRDCVDKIIRIDHKDGSDPSMLLGVWRGAMAQFVYFKVDPALEKMKDWEAEGKPMFDGWYSKKLKTMACIPYLAIQQDGYSDAAGEHRTWADRFAFEEDMMKYALREFMERDNLHPSIDHADPRQTVLREMDRTYGFFTPSLPSPAS
jgi:hypothetical protein